MLLLAQLISYSSSIVRSGGRRDWKNKHFAGKALFVPPLMGAMAEPADTIVAPGRCAVAAQGPMNGDEVRVGCRAPGYANMLCGDFI